MSYTVNTPGQPTHAISHIDNWDGEGDMLFSFAFIVDGDYYHFDGGSPVLEFKGDKILNSWELKGNNNE